MRNMKTYAWILLSFLLIGCEKKYYDSRDYPRIETLSVQTTADGAIFQGNFLVPGKSEIMDHGFTWAFNFPDVNHSDKASLGPLETPGGFSTEIHGLQKGKEYNVRAYAVSSNYQVYGQNLSFTLK